MGVKIADKLEQFNNGTYYLVDSSAVEYVDKDGNTKSVKEALDSTPTDNSTHKTVIFENNIDMGKYLLLAKITNANYSNNIIKFSCPNYKGVNDAGFKYENDMDIYKFELHFNTGSRREINSYGVTLKQHGLGLYSYPLSNPKNTEPRLEEAVRLYWDYSNGDIYVFLVDIMTAIPHCVLEYTGSGTLIRNNTFVMDDLYNRRDGINGTWEESKWKSIPYNKLEVPPIYELGGGSAEGTTTKVTLAYNSNTFKIDITKGNQNWNGNMKFGYCVDRSYGEIIISSLGKTDVMWNHSTGLRYVKSVTYTIDPDDNAHVTIGIELYDIVYGVHQLEMAGDFATINSFTGDAFTGESVAKRSATRGGNNGVGILCEVEDLGLTKPCTTVQIAQAMRNLTTDASRIPTNGMMGIFENGGNKITDAPSQWGLLQINVYGYDRIMIRYDGVSNSTYAGSWIGQIKGSNGTFSGITWGKIHKDDSKEDDYIPDMYDRNANGDIPVVPFDRLANCIAVRQNAELVSTTETDATYDEDYVGGYAFMGVNDILVKNKEMFNKIKVLVHIPGVLRIGIVNDKILEPNPRYSTCLVKWLVADFVAFTGMKEYDIDDTVLEEGQSIFLECRVGVSSWYLNTGEATQVGAVTYPANSCTTGLNIADKLDTTANNALFKSQKVNSSSCLTSFGGGMYGIGGNMRSNFATRAYNSAKGASKEAYENLEYFGGLNIGLYRRTKYSDTRVCKCIENGMNSSWVGNDTVTKIYAPYGQEKIVGKSVYAFKLDVKTSGNLTIYHLKGKSLDTVQVIDKYTHYVRAKGLQTIHLPFDIKLNSTDEYIGFGGLHYKSTSDNIVRHSCCWHYLDTSQAKWMTTIDNSAKQFYSIGISNTDYPEKFTSFETNSNYLNIELICRGEKRSPLEDKYISFTGDSITTFAGFCTTKTGYPEGNPAGDNAVYYPSAGKVVNNVDATWWGILARDNRMKILRNDAWSGSKVSSSEGSTDTKCLCGTKRRYYLRNGYDLETKSTYPVGRPEIIVSMIGTNDLSGNVELGQAMFSGIIGAEEEYKTILSAFSLFCRRLHAEEGNGGAKIVHFLIPRGSDYGYANASGLTIAELSLQFERIAKAWGQYFIPLSYFNGIKPSTPKRWSCPTGSMFKNTNAVEFPSADGLHPNAMGMEAIADGVHRFLCSIM